MQSLSVSDLFGIYVNTFYDKVTVKVKKSAIQRMNKYILPSIGETQASLITPKDIYELILPIREKAKRQEKFSVIRLECSIWRQRWDMQKQIPLPDSEKS